MILSLKNCHNLLHFCVKNFKSAIDIRVYSHTEPDKHNSDTSIDCEQSQTGTKVNSDTNIDCSLFIDSYSI